MFFHRKIKTISAEKWRFFSLHRTSKVQTVGTLFILFAFFSVGNYFPWILNLISSLLGMLLDLFPCLLPPLSINTPVSLYLTI